MKDVIGGKSYNTETSVLVKYAVKKEDLTNGYFRYVLMSLYCRMKGKDYFLYVSKVAVSPGDRVIDVSDEIYPVSEEFADNFSHKYDDTRLLAFDYS